MRLEPELFCLACGTEMPEPLCRTASLRCHACREAGEPISFELALHARELTRKCVEELRRDAVQRLPAA